MSWVVFAVLGAIFGSLREIAEKYALKGEHTLEFLVIRGLFITFITLFFIPFINFDLSTEAYILITMVAIIASSAVFYHRKALKHLEVSVVDPLLNINTLMVLIIAYLFLGEKINSVQTLGILLLVIGTYILEVDEKHHGLLKPFKKLVESKYTLMILGAAFFFAVTSTLDRFILTNYTDALTYFFLVHLIMHSIFFTIHAVKYQFKNIGKLIKKQGLKISMPAIFNVLAVLFLYKAVESAFSIALVVAIFRSRSLITTIEGGRFFHEDHLVQKGIACAIMVVGAILVII